MHNQNSSNKIILLALLFSLVPRSKLNIGIKRNLERATQSFKNFEAGFF